MADSTAARTQAGRRTLGREMLNPATLRGGLAVVLGSLVLVLHDQSVTLAAVGVGLALVGSGLYDLWYALTGRRRGDRRPSRWVALVRAPFSLLFAGLAALVPDMALGVLVGIVGLYIGVRGLLLLGLALVQADSEVRTLRAAVGLASVGVGVLAFVAPQSLAVGLIPVGALTAVVLGTMLLAYGWRGYQQGLGTEVTGKPVVDIVWDWIRAADVGERRRHELADTLYFEEPGRGPKLMAWWVMLALSVTIATYAVLQDSTAVVIGAMLIAPLMVPILGLAGALVNGWRGRAAQSAALVGAGVLAAVMLSYALSLWAPVALSFETNTQITSRVSPSLPDMVVAVAAGAAGAFATVNIRVASSIAGVAIAVALVPPLSVVGISLGAERYADAGGAFLLFATNFVAIVLAAAAVFAVGGFAQPSRLRQHLVAVLATMAPFAALASVILVPLVFTSEGLIATATAQRQAVEVVDDWLDDTPEFQVRAVTVREDEVAVELIGPGEPPDVGPLQQSLIDELGRAVGLTVTTVPADVQQRDAPAD